MLQGMEGKVDSNWAGLVARAAWLATFVVPLLLAGLLLAVKTAHADPAGPAVAPPAFEEGLELEEEAEADPGAECTEATAEFEAGELDEEDFEEICEGEDEDEARAKGSGALAPEECVLRSAHAHAVTSGKSNKLKLTIGYTTFEPVAATIEVGHVTTLHRHLGRSGVLRLVRPLHQHLDRLVVDIRIPSVERAGCPSRRLVLSPG